MTAARLCVSFGLLALASICSAEDEYLIKPEDDGWYGMRPGSWVSSSVDTEENGEKSHSEDKYTLLRIEEKKLVMRYDGKEDGKPVSKDEDHALPPDVKVHWEEVGNETLEVDGQKYECRVLERKHKVAKGKTRSWRATVKGEVVVLKEVVEAPADDGGSWSQTTRVLKLKEDVAIGDRKVECKLEETVSEGKKGDETTVYTVKVWLSNDIPGGQARIESSTSVNGKVTSKSTTVITGFEVKREE